MTSKLYLLRSQPWLDTIRQAGQTLGDSAPAGVVPWSFYGSGLTFTASHWSACDAVLMPIAFNALSTRDWPIDYQMSPEKQDEFFLKFNTCCANILKSLPSYQFKPDRHIFIQWGDLEQDLPCLSRGRNFKVSCLKTSQSEAMPYFIEDLEHLKSINRSTFQSLDTKHATCCSFIGNLNSHPLRHQLAKTLQSLDPDQKLCSMIHTLDGPQSSHRKNYLDAIEHSQFILCPRGGG